MSAVAAAKPSAPAPAAWTYASGLVSALEARLLSRAATVDLLGAPSTEDLVARLRQTLLCGPLGAAADALALAEGVEACAAEFLDRFARACPTRAVVDVFQRGVEWRAFRAHLRVRALEAEPRSVVGSRVPEQAWERCWAGGDVGAELAPFAGTAAAVQAAMPREERDQRLVDELSFVGECRDLLGVAREVGSEAVVEWTATWLRLRIALALLRCRRNGWGHTRAADALDDLGVARRDIAALVAPEGGDWRVTLARLGLPAVEDLEDAAPLAHVERLADEAVTALVRGARGIPFGPEPVFAFLWGVRTEALNLRLVAAAVVAGLPRDTIERDVRQTYV